MKEGPVRVAHLTTVDMSLRFLVFPQLQAVLEKGGLSIGISAPGPWVEELEEAGIRHVPLDASTRGMDLAADLRAARQLWRALRAERPDVLHTHNPKPGLYGRVLGRLAGIPIIVNTVHGLYATESDRLRKRLLVYGLEALAVRCSDAELVQNPEDLALMKRWRIAPAGRMRLLGNGVDLERFDPARFSTDRRTSLRHQLGVGDEQVLVGMVGRLVAEKGYPELFAAAALLDDRYVVACIGPHDPDKPDALPEELLEAARAAGVRLLGMRDDVDELYAAMDLFVLPSHREGFPRAAMEAAAMGLPIVATDIRGCREVVEHGTNGLLVRVGDVEALVAAISAIGDDPDLRAEMGEAGRRRALELFDERQVVRIVMDTYREVARRKGLSQLFTSGDEQVEVRVAEPADVAVLARLHASSIDTGFLPRLGLPFLKRLYQALVRWEDGVVLVADAGAGPVGFVAGVGDIGRFYRHFARRHGLRAALAALPHLVRPDNLRRAWETFRYQGGGVGVEAELVSMAVAPQLRGQGVGNRLGVDLLRELGQRGNRSVKVVVGAENQAALRAYRKMGFGDVATLEVHAGEPSQVLVWSGSS
ncbi:MAG: GNAT family N-acetyltransferase [Actinomycetota bacterium]|nr:GNAT family N-acetyltransferase [Actinomycetota bacterium]